MLESLHDKFMRLAALYEQKAAECESLKVRLRECESEASDNKQLIVELQQQIENLKLAGAFGGTSASSSEAKEKIDGLIRGIDRCISLLEK